MRESGGNPNAYNGNSSTGDRSFGYFQINMLGSLGPARLKQFGLKSEKDLLNPLVNARVAYQMSKGGTDWGHWAYGPNAYRKDPGLDAKVEKFKAQFPGGAAPRGALPLRVQPLHRLYPRLPPSLESP